MFMLEFEKLLNLRYSNPTDEGIHCRWRDVEFDKIIVDQNKCYELPIEEQKEYQVFYSMKDTS